MDIVNFIDAQPDLSVGYNEINFFKSKNIIESQIGYSFDSNGKSLTGEADGDWRDSWIVIATDQLGDPIFVDSETRGFTVYSAAHGEGTWEPYIISDTLIGFKRIIGQLQKLAIGRASPVEIEKNPINCTEQDQFLTYASQENSNTETWYWELFLEQ